MKRGLSSSLEQTDGRNFTGSNSLSSDDEVKLKPSHNKLTDSGEKSIMGLLSSVDVQLQKSKDFAEKLAKKKSVMEYIIVIVFELFPFFSSAINREGYNREPVEVTPPISDDTDSIRYSIMFTDN